MKNVILYYSGAAINFSHVLKSTSITNEFFLSYKEETGLNTECWQKKIYSIKLYVYWDQYFIVECNINT